MGILDIPNDPDERSAQVQGLLNAGFGILANNHGLDAGWAAIGKGGQAGMGAYQAGLLAPVQRKLLQAQTSEQQAKADQAQLGTEMLKRRVQFFQGLQNGTQQPGNTPQGYSAAPDDQPASAAASSDGVHLGGVDKMSPRRARAMSYLNLSDQMMAAGLPDDAASYAKLGKDLLPTLKDSKVVTDPRNGQRTLINQYDDGSTERLPYGPDQEKLMDVNAGGTHQLLNPYTGQPMAAINNTVTPDARLSSVTTMRGQNITGANDQTKTYFDTGMAPQMPPGVPGMGAPMPQQPPQMPGRMVPPGMPQSAPVQAVPPQPMMPNGPGPIPGRITPGVVPSIGGQIRPPVASPIAALPPKAQVALIQSQQQERDKSQQTQADQNIAANNAAQDMKMRTADIRSIMQNYTPGPGQTWKMEHITKPLNSVFPGLNADKIASYDELEKNATRLAADQTKLLGSREAAQIFTMLRSANPNPNLNAQAMNHILAGLDASADYASAKASAQEAWRNQQGSLNGFEIHWSKQVSPNVFALKYLSPDEQTTLFKSLKKNGQLPQLMQQYQTAKGAGYLQ